MDERRRWKRQPVKLAEVLVLRVTAGDRLRGATLADQLDVTEAELTRRAWLRGLELIEKETAS